MTLYMIGGSLCSGKSTVASLLAQLVREEAQKLAYPSLVTDSSRSEKETAAEIARILK